MIMNKALKMSIEELSRRFDAKLASLNASDSGEKINSLFTSGVENNRITRPKAGESVISCKEALEQPAQEPVAWIKSLEIAYIQLNKQDKRLTSQGWRTNLGLKPEPDDVPLYTHPAPSWQGLSDDEIVNLIRNKLLDKEQITIGDLLDLLLEQQDILERKNK